MRIKCLSQGHYCHCQQIRTGDLMIESPWSYDPLSHTSFPTSYPIFHVGCGLLQLNIIDTFGLDARLFVHLVLSAYICVNSSELSVLELWHRDMHEIWYPTNE